MSHDLQLPLFGYVGSHLITAANFCMNGKLAVVGTYDGRCIFYDTEVCKIIMMVMMMMM